MKSLVFFETDDHSVFLHAILNRIHFERSQSRSMDTTRRGLIIFRNLSFALSRSELQNGNANIFRNLQLSRALDQSANF